MTHANIFRKFDDRIVSYVRNHYVRYLNEHKDIKLQSIATIIAVGLSINSISPFFYDGFEAFGELFTVFRVAFALFCLALYINAFYYWRVFLELRKNGVISDKNLFFAESTGLGRKILFYIAFVFNSMHILRFRLIPADLGEALKRARFATREDIYHDAGLTFFQNLVFSIVVVECLRLMYRKSFAWSNKKHFVIVLLITLTLSTIQLLARYSFSGHGMFW